LNRASIGKRCKHHKVWSNLVLNEAIFTFHNQNEIVKVNLFLLTWTYTASFPSILFLIFSIEEFIPLLRERMNVLNPYVRQFLVGWITVLDSVPDIDMLGFLPDFLDGKCIVWRMVILFLNILYEMKAYHLIICNISGLFNMLSDSSHEIRQQADTALSEFLKEIKNSPVRLLLMYFSSFLWVVKLLELFIVWFFFCAIAFFPLLPAWEIFGSHYPFFYGFPISACISLDSHYLYE